MNAGSTASPPRSGSGGEVLSLLATPLCVPVLRAHRVHPLRLPDLCELLGDATPASLRRSVGRLRDFGALERRVRPGMPYTVENELTELGEELLVVAELAEAWLSLAPDGPLTLGGDLAKQCIRALVGGWSSTILRALAATPMSLTELGGAIPDLSYPSLERRLSAMRAVGQVEAVPGEGRRPYAVTQWTRLATGVLAAAGRCECRHPADSSGHLAEADIVAMLLLAAPLVGPSPAAPTVHVGLENGVVKALVSDIDAEPEAWIAGRPAAWLDAIADGDVDGLRFGGRCPDSARSLLADMRRALATS